MHRAKKANYEEGIVCDVDPLTVTVHKKQHKNVQWDEIDDENVSAPGTHLKFVKMFMQLAVRYSFVFGFKSIYLF